MSHPARRLVLVSACAAAVTLSASLRRRVSSTRQRARATSSISSARRVCRIRIGGWKTSTPRRSRPGSPPRTRSPPTTSRTCRCATPSRRGSPGSGTIPRRRFLPWRAASCSTGRTAGSRSRRRCTCARDWLERPSSCSTRTPGRRTVRSRSPPLPRPLARRCWPIPCPKGGADWQTIRVKDLSSGKELADDVKWMRFSGLSWTKDGKGFFYSRYPEPPAGKGPPGGALRTDAVLPSCRHAAVAGRPGLRTQGHAVVVHRRQRHGRRTLPDRVPR